MKDTKLGQFILYSGVICLKNNLEKKKYEHFLTHYFVVSILLSNIHMIDYAEDLLKHCVVCKKLIYGPHFLTHNVHNLLYSTDDARKFGNLNSYSIFS